MRERAASKLLSGPIKFTFCVNSSSCPTLSFLRLLLWQVECWKEFSFKCIDRSQIARASVTPGRTQELNFSMSAIRRVFGWWICLAMAMRKFLQRWWTNEKVSVGLFERRQVLHRNLVLIEVVMG